MRCLVLGLGVGLAGRWRRLAGAPRGTPGTVRCPRPSSGTGGWPRARVLREPSVAPRRGAPDTGPAWPGEPGGPGARSAQSGRSRPEGRGGESGSGTPRPAGSSFAGGCPGRSPATGNAPGPRSRVPSHSRGRRPKVSDAVRKGGHSGPTRHGRSLGRRQNLVNKYP